MRIRLYFKSLAWNSPLKMIKTNRQKIQLANFYLVYTRKSRHSIANILKFNNIKKKRESKWVLKRNLNLKSSISTYLELWAGQHSFFFFFSWCPTQLTAILIKGLCSIFTGYAGWPFGLFGPFLKDWRSRGCIESYFICKQSGSLLSFITLKKWNMMIFLVWFNNPRYSSLSSFSASLFRFA